MFRSSIRCVLATTLAFIHVALAQQQGVKTIDTPLVICKGHRDRVNAVRFTPDGSMVVSGSLDKTVRIWKTDTGQLLKTLSGHTKAVTGIDVSPSGLLIASGSADKLVKVWEIKTGEQLYELDGHLGRVNCVTYHPDGLHVLTGCCDLLMRVWDVESELPRSKIPDRSCVEFICLTKDATTAVTGLYNGEISIFDLASGQRKRLIAPRVRENNRVTGLALTGDGKRIIASYSAGDSGVFDSTTGKQLQRFAREATVLALSPDEKSVAVGRKGLEIIDLASGNPVLTLGPAQTAAASCAAFSADGKHLAAGRDAGGPSILIWDISSALSH